MLIRKHPLSSKLLVLLTIILIFGIFFRFSNLGTKVYWFDEAYTSLRISGYTEAEVIQTAFNGDRITSLDLQIYQHPNSEKTVLGTIGGLASEEPQHPPLYYVLARLWAQTFGSSAATIRSLSALLSLLVFPSLYWLCLELFQSPLTGWMAIALVAVSPIHVVFAQEARQYSLWTGLIVAMSAAFLRAIRRNDARSWTIYTVLFITGLYTFLFSGLVAIGHGLYLVVLSKWRLTPTLQAYFRSSAMGLLAFSPWIVAIATGQHSVEDTTAWSTRSSSTLAIAKAWTLNLRRVFFDADFTLDSRLAYIAAVALVYTFILLIEGISLYSLIRRTPHRVWLFIVLLIGVTATAILLPDVVLGGQRSTATRYAIPCFLGIQLAIAHTLTRWLTDQTIPAWQQAFSRLAFAGLLSLSLLSGVLSLQTNISWSKVVSFYNPPIAHLINQTQAPLLISDLSMGVGDVLSLSRLLDRHVTLQLVTNATASHVADTALEAFSHVFLLTYSKTLRETVANQYQAEIVPAYKERGKVWLWMLAK